MSLRYNYTFLKVCKQRLLLENLKQPCQDMWILWMWLFSLHWGFAWPDFNLTSHSELFINSTDHFTWMLTFFLSFWHEVCTWHQYFETNCFSDSHMCLKSCRWKIWRLMMWGGKRHLRYSSNLCAPIETNHPPQTCVCPWKRAKTNIKQGFILPKWLARYPAGSLNNMESSSKMFCSFLLLLFPSWTLVCRASLI